MIKTDQVQMPAWWCSRAHRTYSQRHCRAAPLELLAHDALLDTAVNSGSWHNRQQPSGLQW